MKRRLFLAALGAAFKPTLVAADPALIELYYNPGRSP
jgi:hypothetical protein